MKQEKKYGKSSIKANGDVDLLPLPALSDLKLGKWYRISTFIKYDKRGKLIVDSYKVIGCNNGKK